jgi:hypothetical protein
LNISAISKDSNTQSEPAVDKSYDSIRIGGCLNSNTGPIPKYSDQFFDFFTAAKIIIQLQQIKSIQK